jgi:hypothetical protein
LTGRGLASRIPLTNKRKLPCGVFREGRGDVDNRQRGLGTATETQRGSLDDGSLQHSRMQVDNSTRFLAVGINSMGHAMCELGSSGAKGSVDSANQRNESAKRSDTIKILLVLLLLISSERFEGRQTSVAGSETIYNSDVKVPVTPTLSTGKEISTSIELTGRASTSSSAGRQRTEERFFAGGVVSAPCEIELPGTDNLQVAARHPTTLLAAKAIVNVETKPAAGAVRGQRVRKGNAHTQGNCITEGLPIKAHAQLVQRDKGKPR